MKIKLLAALAALGISGNALAAECTLISPPGFSTERLYAASEIIKLRADAVAGTGTYIGRANSPALSSQVIYNCDGDTIYGSRPVNSTLIPYGNYPNMYETNIKGIGVKFVATPPDGDEGANLPMDRYVAGSKPGASTTKVTVNQGRFVAYFYKLSDNVDLSTPNMSNNLLFTKKDIGYNKVQNTDVSIYSIENIYIVGIPVCTVDSPVPVDFNTVNASDVRSGVEKPFEFGITCKTDYGNYNVTATIEAKKRTLDGNYIKVTDSKTNDDSLIIEITDAGNKRVKVDNSTDININDLPSGRKADFKWHAKLKKEDGKPYPAQGPFHAEAIITLNIK